MTRLDRFVETAPETIRIGAFDWTTAWTKEKLELDGQQCWGLCCKNDHQLEFWTDQRPSIRHLTETVVHELLHAIYFERGLAKKVHEEEVVAAMSYGLCALFVANPQLLDFIKKGLK